MSDGGNVQGGNDPGKCSSPFRTYVYKDLNSLQNLEVHFTASIGIVF